MKLVSEGVEIWKIVVHIGFKFYSVASGTFPTASTFELTGGQKQSEALLLPVRVERFVRLLH